MKHKRITGSMGAIMAKIKTALENNPNATYLEFMKEVLCTTTN